MEYIIKSGCYTYVTSGSPQAKVLKKNGGMSLVKAVLDILSENTCCTKDITADAITATTVTATTSVSTDTISEYTAAAGVTIDGVKLKDGGITSGTFVAGLYPQGASDNITAGTGGAIAVTNYFTTINTDAGGDAFTLADGTKIGQLKLIRLVVDGGGDAVITPANLASGTTITMNDASDEVELQWNGTDWVVIKNLGATVA